MKTTKSVALLMTGAVIGMGLSGPAANAAGSFFQAQRTPHPIYVDGKQVQMETYAIDGHNYVKLRDIGQAVGFEVYWDGSAAQIVSDQPYTGQPPAQANPSAVPNHSDQANASVFTGYLTAEVYDVIREAVLTKETTPFGSAVKGSLHLRWDDKEGLKKAEEERNQINAVLAALGPYPGYEMVSAGDGSGYLCEVRYTEVDAPAAEHTRDFIASLEGLSERRRSSGSRGTSATASPTTSPATSGPTKRWPRTASCGARVCPSPTASSSSATRPESPACLSAAATISGTASTPRAAGGMWM